MLFSIDLERSACSSVVAKVITTLHVFVYKFRCIHNKIFGIEVEPRFCTPTNVDGQQDDTTGDEYKAK